MQQMDFPAERVGAWVSEYFLLGNVSFDFLQCVNIGFQRARLSVVVRFDFVSCRESEGEGSKAFLVREWFSFHSSQRVYEIRGCSFHLCCVGCFFWVSV